MHPADLGPELEPLLSSRHEPPVGDVGQEDLRADALAVLTALATAAVPPRGQSRARRGSLPPDRRQ
jgi:hypothetical protein